MTYCPLRRFLDAPDIDHLATFPQIGIERHVQVLRRPGCYRVIFCVDPEWVEPMVMHAVIDDFGDLVRVQ